MNHLQTIDFSERFVSFRMFQGHLKNWMMLWIGTFGWHSLHSFATVTSSLLKSFSHWKFWMVSKSWYKSSNQPNVMVYTPVRTNKKQSEHHSFGKETSSKLPIQHAGRPGVYKIRSNLKCHWRRIRWKSWRIRLAEPPKHEIKNMLIAIQFFRTIESDQEWLKKIRKVVFGSHCL